MTTSGSRSTKFRKTLFWFLIVFFIWLVITRRTEITSLAKTLHSGRIEWILAAAVLQVVYFVFYTGIYRASFYTVEIDSSIKELLPVTFASIFVSVVAPSGGASAAALFVDDASKKGHSPSRAAAATVLTLVADFSTFTIICLVGLSYLFLSHNLKGYEIGAAILLILMTLGLSSILLVGLVRPQWLHSVLGNFQTIVNRFSVRIHRPKLLRSDWAQETADEFIEAGRAIHSHPGRLFAVFQMAFFAHLTDIASLYMVFLGFSLPVEFGVLMAGFAIGMLFLIVSITPYGIGVVEGIMTLTFTSLGVPTELAAIVTFSFRGLNFWIPLLLGFFFLRRIRSFKG
jgi:glycosyltransferase 2 family protein